MARAAALFLAVSYFHVRDAHYLKHDIPTGLLVVLVLLCFDRAMERKSTGSYVLAGLAMGTAFATHYYTIFLAPAFVLCHWTASRLRDLKKLMMAATASAATFFVLSPFVLLDFPVALEHMRENRRVVMDRSLDAGTVFFPSLPDYVKFLAEQGLGYFLLGLVIAGWFLMARRGKAKLVLWGAFPLFLLGLVSYTFFAGRYMNPIAPSLAVAGGVTIGTVHRRWGTVAATGVALFACAQPLVNDIQVDRLFSGKDTRTVAREWVLENVPDEAALALQSYSVPLPQSIHSLRESLAANRALDELERRGKYSLMADVAESRRPAYELLFLGKGDEKNRIYFDYREAAEEELGPLRARGVEYIVLRHPPGTTPPEVAAFFARVRQQGRLLVRVSPFENGDEKRRPYMDNEDWPATGRLTHKGPLTEIWCLED